LDFATVKNADDDERKPWCSTAAQPTMMQAKGII
jgi:hypothetical protein